MAKQNEPVEEEAETPAGWPEDPVATADTPGKEGGEYTVDVGDIRYHVITLTFDTKEEAESVVEDSRRAGNYVNKNDDGQDVTGKGDKYTIEVEVDQLSREQLKDGKIVKVSQGSQVVDE
jgi:alkyl hydroperoxide reductase subunit AhpF